MARGKKYLQALENIDRDKTYSIEEAVGLLKSFPTLKFDQTVEITMNLGIDGRQADQILRGTVTTRRIGLPSLPTRWTRSSSHKSSS